MAQFKQQHQIKFAIMVVKLLLLLLVVRVWAIEDVYVYEERPNPRNYPAYKNTKKYRLRGPTNWKALSESEWEGQGEDGKHGIYQWERRWRHIAWSSNECVDLRHGRGNSRQRLMQSPLVLQNDLKCEDEHRMRGKSINKCDFDKIVFHTTDHSARARFVGCKKQPMVDFSHMPSFFRLQYLEVKVPSEHTVRVSSRSYRRYDGELTFAHWGTEGSLKDDILNIAVFLKAGNKEHNDYEKFLRRWERYQRQRYRECDMDWHEEDLCALKKKYGRRRLQARPAYNTSTTPTKRSSVDTSGAKHSNIIDLASNTTTGMLGHIGEDEKHEILEHGVEFSSPDDALEGEDPEDVHRMLDKYYMYKQLIPGRYYWRYQGSTTTPPCYEHVKWRVFQEPLQISYDQLNRTEYVISKHINDDCELATVCRPRSSKNCKVNCNRPLQQRSYAHRLQNCNKWNGKL